MTYQPERDVVESDLLSISNGVIGHQVNCQGVMGAGLALAIATKWPIVKQRYVDLVRSSDKPSLLGMIQPVRVTEELRVFNLFGQLNYGMNKRQTDYEALSSIASKLVERDITIHLPYGMGCGLAGGDWDIVQSIFSEVKGSWYRLSLWGG